MNTLAAIRAGLDKVLEAIVVLLMLALALVIIIGFTSRLLDAPLSWTGEVASTGLAWLTYYGGALAASKGAHITCPNIVNMLPPAVRVPVALVAEAFTIAFFVVLAWTGLKVVVILQGSSLVSLPFVSQQLTQSVIPIASCLFIIAELLRLPEMLAQARGAGFQGDHELEDEMPQAAEVIEQNRVDARQDPLRGR
ncbi:TRAP transporter small permease [Salinisphaera aquimarina]|uniref:TRAP transporter small permease protein n=1 Tax=Salinisphaera aquimarina TaxID=2094031 RepID=A0ABV7EL12_9GAMM